MCGSPPFRARHAAFHRNVIVPHSLSHFGFRLALDGTRLALSADVAEGDWTEPIRAPGGRCVTARSLLVVHEMGPSWLRTSAAFDE
jgi:hypothetical protein